MLPLSESMTQFLTLEHISGVKESIMQGHPSPKQTTDTKQRSEMSFMLLIEQAYVRSFLYHTPRLMSLNNSQKNTY